METDLVFSVTSLTFWDVYNWKLMLFVIIGLNVLILFRAKQKDTWPFGSAVMKRMQGTKFNLVFLWTIWILIAGSHAIYTNSELQHDKAMLSSGQFEDVRVMQSSEPPLPDDYFEKNMLLTKAWVGNQYYSMPGGLYAAYLVPNVEKQLHPKDHLSLRVAEDDMVLEIKKISKNN